MFYLRGHNWIPNIYIPLNSRGIGHLFIHLLGIWTLYSAYQSPFYIGGPGFYQVIWGFPISFTIGCIFHAEAVMYTARVCSQHVTRALALVLVVALISVMLQPALLLLWFSMCCASSSASSLRVFPPHKWHRTQPWAPARVTGVTLIILLPHSLYLTYHQSPSTELFTLVKSMHFAPPFSLV